MGIGLRIGLGIGSNGRPSVTGQRDSSLRQAITDLKLAIVEIEGSRTLVAPYALSVGPDSVLWAEVRVADRNEKFRPELQRFKVSRIQSVKATNESFVPAEVFREVLSHSEELETAVEFFETVDEFLTFSGSKE